jgi:Heterokaryon incompatibility protein (HET)
MIVPYTNTDTLLAPHTTTKLHISLASKQLYFTVTLSLESNSSMPKPLFNKEFEEFLQQWPVGYGWTKLFVKNFGSLVLNDIRAALPTTRRVPSRGKSVPEQLCSICRKLDFVYMFNERSFRAGTPRLVLGLYDDIAAKSYCAFCRLIITAINKTLITPITPGYRDADGKELYCQLRGEEFLQRKRWQRCIKVELRSMAGGKKFARLRMKLNTWELNEEERWHNNWVKGVLQFCDAQIILHIDSAPLYPYPTRRLIFHNSAQQDRVTCMSEDPYPMLGCTPSQSFSYDKVREWHQTCGWCAETPLTGNYHIISAAPLGMRVIDATSMKIISAPQNCVYVALSYVWGQMAHPLRATKANREVLETENGLWKLKIPRTIQDAIDTVKILGFRYLWVDSLCIVQDDPEYQMQQIKAMDQIYQAAALTIIAAGGNSADGSLLPQSRDQIIHVEEIQGLKIMARNRPFDQAHLGSTWNTRGWCYQEMMLSSKILLFTNTEVYYDCSHYTWCESMEWGDCNGRVYRPAPRTKDEKIEGENGGDFWKHWYPMTSALERYTLRSLTNETDVLSAIWGTLKSLSPTLVDMAGGVPIPSLIYSMLWQPAATGRRRSSRHSPFPSWSWIGWVGPTRFPLLFDQTTSYYWRRSKISGTPTDRSSIVTAWYFRNSNNSPIHLDGVLLLPHHGVSSNHTLEIVGQEDVISKTKNLTDLEIEQLQNHNVVLIKTISDSYEYASLSVLPDPQNYLSGTSEEATAAESIQESGVLQFWTESAFLTVSKDYVRVVAKFGEPFEHDPALCQFKIIDEQCEWIGNVQMTANWSGAGSKYEFIMLSVNMVEAGDNDVGIWSKMPKKGSWEARWNLFHMRPYPVVCVYDVLLIEWRMGVAYRMGLGSVYYAAWDAASPVRKLITLG